MNQGKLEEKIISSKVQNLALFPDTGYDIFSDFTQWKAEDAVFDFNVVWHNIRCIKTRSMKKAVKFCFENTQDNHTVLLSSAAQSYSLWKNFEEKW